MKTSMMTVTASLAVGLLFGAACGDDGDESQSSSAASSADCKEANDLAKSCRNEPLDCKEDPLQIACALENPDAFCEGEGEYFSCIISKADKRDNK